MNRQLLASLLVFICCAICSAELCAQGIYNLYGMAYTGGTAGTGAIFKAASDGSNPQPAASFSTDYPFGINPFGDLVAYNGKLYGMTKSGGGANSYGTIISIDPAATIPVITKLADFTLATGINPEGSLVAYGSKLYGMTYTGGANGGGAIFSIDPAAATPAITKLADFTSGTSGTGYNPYSSLVVYGTKLYGVANSGGANSGGTIFSIDPGVASPSITKLADFTTGTTGTGYTPRGSLMVYNSKFYGTTYNGGINGVGTVYFIDPAAATPAITKLADFSSGTGCNPRGSLTAYNGKLYGMTYTGGGGLGTIFSIDPAVATPTITKLIDFGSSSGGRPQGSLLVFGSKLYGVTYNGGANNGGTIISFDPAAATPSVTKLADFNAATGNSPKGSLLLYNSKLYGMTYQGGVNNAGTIISIDPVATIPTITNLADFTAGTGKFPFGSLMAFGTRIYGMTSAGGFANGGSIFSIDPAAATPAITHLADFTAGTGNTPYGSLVAYNGKIYGMTSGGSSNNGTVISIDPATAIPTIIKLADFTTITGINPYGSLVVYNGKLYGMTSDGGANSAGTIISIDPAAAIPSITKLADFTTGTSGTGAYPSGSLVVYGANLYGMTSSGGANNYGTIFSINPAATTPTITKLGSFSVATGYDAAGSLTVYGSKLYGMTGSGGVNGFGTIISIDPAATTPVITKKADLSAATGSNPIYSQLLQVAARIAPGTTGTCESEPSVSGSVTAWVPIINSTNDAVAEINPNGNNLGTVSTSLYTANTSSTIREDASHKTFLDRNITITPTTQPTSGVDVRIYITEAEYQHLKNSTNSLSVPSGISAPTGLQLYKVSASCSGTGSIPSSMTALSTSVISWPTGGYVLSATVSSFSTFYIGSGTSTPLPVGLLAFSAKLITDNDALLMWSVTEAVDGKAYTVERSADGATYSAVGAVTATPASEYNLHDYQPLGGKSYYRLHIQEKDGSSSYSNIVSIIISSKQYLQVTPSPAHDYFTIATNAAAGVTATLNDMQGKVRQSFAISNGMQVNISGLPAGVYLLKMSSGEVVKLVKE